MKYTPGFFYESMPEWKRKKDPIICRLIYRPLSYIIAAICANIGITANMVSYFSIIVAILGGLFFAFGTRGYNLVAAILVNIWITLDCVDGNLARSIKKQPFGEFADAISGYILTSVICLAMGFGTYKTGGVLLSKNNEYIFLLGGIAALADPLMRLIYQKYKATVRQLKDEGLKIEESDNHDDHTQVTSLKTRIEETMGFGGILPAVVLIAVVFNALDVIVLYCSIYYGGSCIVMSALYIRKAIKNEKL